MKFHIISLVFICTFIFSQEIDPPEAVTKVATCAANWLKIESGVKGISMGGSQVASGSGISGIFYNPKSYYLAGISHNTLGYVTKNFSF